ncbi:hypothetical protein [Parabacteroides sp. PF5-6]|uniref:hypothetical protein n=1 Tax=Parabacteroides sp. PF5-6 TaxID=1742403 RepID=UPI002405B1E1|nr:hypothetical protein [Parabacteroides sp. PF5-6]MDF9830193.1 hypothetical protein [Parabacteroides sp. PF5-6]
MMKRILLLSMALLALVVGRTTATTYDVSGDLSTLQNVTLQTGDVINLTADVTKSLTIPETVTELTINGNDHSWMTATGLTIILTGTIKLNLKDITIQANGHSQSAIDLVKSGDYTIHSRGDVTLKGWNALIIHSGVSGILTISGSDICFESIAEQAINGYYGHGVHIHSGFQVIIEATAPVFKSAIGHGFYYENNYYNKEEKIIIRGNSAPVFETAAKVNKAGLYMHLSSLEVSTSGNTTFRATNRSAASTVGGLMVGDTLDVTGMTGTLTAEVSGSATAMTSNRGGFYIVGDIGTNGKINMNGYYAMSGRSYIHTNAPISISSNYVGIESPFELNHKNAHLTVSSTNIALRTSSKIIKGKVSVSGSIGQYGSALEIEEEGILHIAADSTAKLNVNTSSSYPGANSITNRGTLVIEGTFENNDSIVNKGLISNLGVITNNSSFTNDTTGVIHNGTQPQLLSLRTAPTPPAIINAYGATLTNVGDIYLYNGELTNNGALINTALGEITGSGTISNTGISDKPATLTNQPGGVIGTKDETSPGIQNNTNATLTNNGILFSTLNASGGTYTGNAIDTYVKVDGEQSGTLSTGASVTFENIELYGFDENVEGYRTEVLDEAGEVIGAMEAELIDDVLTLKLTGSMAVGTHNVSIKVYKGEDSYFISAPFAIQVTAVDTAYHTISLIVTDGITCDYATGSHTIAEGDHLFLSFFPEEASLTAADILFLIDGVETAFNASVDGRGGSYILNPIEKDLDVVIALREYPVTLPEIEGLTITTSGKAIYGQPFTFTISSPTLDLSAMKVFVNGEELTANALRAESYTYTIAKVEGPIVITLEGYTTGHASLATGKIRVAMDNGQLTIDNEMANAVDIAIYSVTGQNVVQLRGLRGSKTVALPAGVYVVRAGTQTWKVMVND